MVHKDPLDRKKFQREYTRKLKASNPVKYMVKAAQYRAKMAGISCTITEEDVQIPKACPYLGLELRPSVDKAAPNSPSLDRINNDLGYVPGNVRVISHLANTCKRNLTEEQLIKFALNVLEIHEVPIQKW